MPKKKKTLLEKFGKVNFAFFHYLIKGMNLGWGRRFLYIGLEDQSVYEDSFQDPVLNISLLGKTFPSPIGIASGFDTSFKYNDILVQYGFGFEEFGTFTLSPTDEEMRLSFLTGQQAVLVSQPFFSNKGTSFVQKALIDRRHLPYIAGISIASNITTTENEVEAKTIFENIEKELVEITQRTAPYCDYIALNLSHPHLPISNILTNISLLEEIIQKMKYTISKVAPIAKPKLLIKLPPDISLNTVPFLAKSFLNIGIDGIIVSGYLDSIKLNRLARKLVGGFICGKPLKNTSTELIAEFYKATKGTLPIIAGGGVFTGDDAFEKIQSGASLIQIHSAILYKGPGIANEIDKRLAFLIKKNGFKDISEAVGSKFKGFV